MIMELYIGCQLFLLVTVCEICFGETTHFSSLGEPHETEFIPNFKGRLVSWVWATLSALHSPSGNHWFKNGHMGTSKTQFETELALFFLEGLNLW